MNKTQKEFDRSVCFMFYNDFHEQIMDVKRDFGIETAFEVYEAIVNYGLYGTEIEKGKLRTLIGNSTLSKIEDSQENRAKWFKGENFEQTKMVAEYYRDHPNASQRAIVDALGGAVKKTKVQKTLAKIKESGLSIDEYIHNVINPNLNNNSNNNSTSNSNNNSKTTTTTNRESSLTELADAQTTASTMPNEEEKKESDKGKKRILKDLTDEELISLKEDFQRQLSYKEMQVKYNLSKDCTNADLGKNIDAILEERKNELEKQKSKERFSKLEIELFKYPDKKAKLMGFTECTSDDMLMSCLKDIDRNIDDIIAFYEDNGDSKNQYDELSFTRWTWKSRESGNFSTYENYIQAVMDSNGYSKAS